IAYDSEGNVKYFKTVKIPLEGTENTVHVLGVSSDITEVKNAYTKINEQNQILESSLSQIKASNEELESLYTENQDLITKIENIIYIMESVFKYENIDDFLKVIFNKIFDFIPEADYGSLWKLNGDSIFYLETKGHDKEKLNSAGLKAENFFIEKEIIIKDNILEYDENYPDIVKNSKKIKKTLLIPILSKDKFYGNFALDLDESNPERFKEDSLRFAKYISNLISLIFSLRESNKAHQVMQEDIIFSLVKMIEFHDEYTKGHSENVAHFSRLMARNMNFDEDKINEIYWSAIIHDVGKLFIDKNILNKPNRLTKDEFNEIKKHPVYAYNILKEISSMENIARYIKYHHERYDGKGYPNGLKGN
ncbi:MAG TPA: HD domain-containing phosphohydrolase, partial [Tepiditoga sp.]|nr:HD domain-containing phosphohydrolase [Tepiditoga sp.]